MMCTLCMNAEMLCTCICRYSANCSVLEGHIVILFCGRREIYTLKDCTLMKSFGQLMLSEPKCYSKTQILPELIGRFYSRTHQSSSNECSGSNTQATTVTSPTTSDDSNSEFEDYTKYCYCQGTKDGEMVGCDNPKCTYQWFHLICLHLDAAPTSKYWYCPDCRKLPQFQRKMKGKGKSKY